MNRFYHSKSISINETIVMDNFSAHHALKVMRIRSNDQLILFNGDGLDYKGKVVSISKGQVKILIKSKKNIDSESNLKVILLQAITSSDKMDFIIQKTTELGVSEIQPIICERSIVKIKNDKIEKKLLHWNQVSIAACEQCGRAKIPIIHKPENITKYLEKITKSEKDIKIILSPQATKSLDNIISSSNIDQNIKVLIGPEGDFTEKELNFSLGKGFLPIKIGPRILRTETAPISILSILQYKYGDIV
ncbi:16S rRNA (uracil(1498)-N(3))-methyltransferase [Methylophilaceae bacterium]|nr:16S rRNA (uracil(1498)-N(3))-methyltransferase [Methylophilaceae bacterium]